MLSLEIQAIPARFLTNDLLQLSQNHLNEEQRALDWSVVFMAKVAIIGSGIAGLFAAIKLADNDFHVTVITKQKPKDSSTNWAQGGIAGILDKTDGIGLDSHIKDTLESGAGLCNEAVVRSIIEEASDRIHDLLEIGVQFELNQDGSFHLAQEGGHSDRRILHAKDATGKEIERALTHRAETHPNITLLADTLAIDLIQAEHGNPASGVSGVWCLDQVNDKVMTIASDAILLATGGVGQLWSQTTNPGVATGDGLAMAWRFGAAVKDMAFIQFHPTALAINTDRPFLITEALRGEGGVILDKVGLAQWNKARESDPTCQPDDFSFTKEHSPLGSMATRDIVARAIDHNLKASGESHVYLVTSHLNAEELQSHFPTIQQRLARNGLKLGVDALPVAPAAHYVVGGIDVDEIGRPSTRDGEIIPDLFAIGEVACTGMHGANRLASNSLLEAVVYASRAASHLIANPPSLQQGELPQWRADGLKDLREHTPIVHDRESLRDTMTREVGLTRRFARLERAKRRLQLLNSEIDIMWRGSLASREIIELRNLALVGTLVCEDAISRKENVGLHYNADLA